MRGAIGTPITLTVQREGAELPIDIKIVRAEITVQAVRSRQEDNIGYIRVSSFSEQTFDGVKTAIDKLTREIGADRVQGWIIDLRNNPGGLLDQSIAISDAFLDQGEIVSTRGRRNNEMQRYNAHIGDLANGKPVIVLINGGSASASEIVAGALQDHRRATIIGTRSFGKGSVQTIVPLGADGALRLTTARYYTPSGTSIQAKGIEPDIEVVQELPPEIAEQITGPPRGEASLKGHLEGEGEEEAEESSGSLAYVPPDPADDTQLNYALDLLRGLQVNSAFPPDPNQGIPN
jgi:carboxyl-terminal processing protease